MTRSTKYFTLERLFGEAEALRLVRAGEQAIREIAAFCREHGIDAQLRMDGTLYTRKPDKVDSRHDRAAIG